VEWKRECTLPSDHAARATHPRANSQLDLVFAAAALLLVPLAGLFEPAAASPNAVVNARFAPEVADRAGLAVTAGAGALTMGAESAAAGASAAAAAAAGAGEAGAAAAAALPSSNFCFLGVGAAAALPAAGAGAAAARPPKNDAMLRCDIAFCGPDVCARREWWSVDFEELVHFGRAGS